MSERHKWADVIIAMANGEIGQWKHGNGRWYNANGHNPMSNPEYEWRIAPRTIMIGDMEVPEPVRNSLSDGDKYFVAIADSYELIEPSIWRGDLTDTMWLSRGIIHLTKDAAIAHAKALIKISGGNV